MPFEFVPQDEYMVVKLTGDCNGGERPQIDEEFEKHLKGTGKKFVIFQCSECGGMSTQFLRQLAQMYRKLKELNGKLALINVNQEIQDGIKKNGLDRLLICKMSLRGALVEFGLAKQKEFDVNFINPFINSAQRVLKIQARIDTTAQKAYVKKPEDPMLMGDISGIIGITSETFNGTLAISFPEKVFLAISENMLSQKYEKIIPEIVDLAGELSNIILGQTKIELNQLGYKIQQAIPSCIWGKDHQIKHFGGGMCIVVPFETTAGIFHMEIMSNNTAKTKAV